MLQATTLCVIIMLDQTSLPCPSLTPLPARSCMQVQYVLNLGLPWASALVMTRLGGSIAELSMQKFSSNVVEKCLKLGEGPELEECLAAIVRELTNSPTLEKLLQDPYGNYVVQSALTVTSGQLHADLVDRIRPHVPAIRSSPFGKRILARSNLLGGVSKMQPPATAVMRANHG